jgi:hypothetical protein
MVSAAVPGHAEQEDDEHQHCPPGDAQSAVVPAEDIPHGEESSTRIGARSAQESLSTTSAAASATTETLRARSAASGVARSVRSSIASTLPSL